MDELSKAYEFIAQAAHDLRNPAAIIGGAASLLQLRWERLSEELRREQVAAISEQANRLRALTEDLLSWASLESGKVPVRLEKVEVRELVERAASEAVPGAPVEIRVKAAEVIADRTHLGRVLENLLANAGKYGAPPIRVEDSASGNEVVLTVCDYGPGVPSEIGDRLFEPFVRGGSASSGTGLGLAIVRGLMEIQGGRVWYERLDKRSCFSIALPAAS